MHQVWINQVLPYIIGLNIVRLSSKKKLRFLLTTFMWLKVVDVKLNMFQICHETMKTMTKKKSNQSSMYVCFCMAHVGSLFQKKNLN